MLDKLKADFDGIIELVNKTPEPLQEMAFKMILEQWFNANAAPRPISPSTVPPRSGDAAAPGGDPGGPMTHLVQVLQFEPGTGHRVAHHRLDRGVGIRWSRAHRCLLIRCAVLKRAAC